MIDYLELLLEQQVREEPEDTLEWDQNVSAVQKRTADLDGTAHQARPATGPGAGAGEQPEFLTQIPAAEPAAWMAGTASPAPGISAAQAGSKTVPGGMDVSETAGFDIYEAPGTHAGFLLAEYSSAVPLFQAQDTALLGVTGGMALPRATGGTGLSGAAGGIVLPGTTGGTALPRVTSGTELPRASEGMELPSGPGGTALSGTPGLYRQMTRAGQAVVGLRYSTRLLTVSEGASASPGLGAEELDELFSRDARRYDSGFSLF